MLLVVAVLVASSGQAQQPAAPGDAGAGVTGTAAGAEQYRLSADDTLLIDVLDVPEISREYRVDPTGSVVIPLISEPLTAAGLTPRQLADAIADRLRQSGMVSHPHVSVQVKASRVHSIAIAGAVKKPQIYPLFSQTTLLDALSQAEGLAEDAGNTAVVTRGEIGLRAEPGRMQSVDLKKLLEDGDAASNVTLYPGDRVTVQRAGIVYVVGAVNRAGGFVLKNDREQMTVLKAVALADNLKSTAEPKKAMIIRKNGAAAGLEIPVDLGRILAGRGPDQSLEANDILFVPDSAGKRALHRAGEAAAQAASLFVYRVP